ncbi:DHHC-type zinc finger family protein isoform 2 [Hibiscus syriacus]|uniref:DHHC-type zinc finger family protein isoform 2 n=1 Tax=Hibiscus syriacus TaxID=106335 RepID=A0A6A3BW90_HIBSY|nr:DHHC-type zinc finger family protein isoform 2 [Hibiscus syriacus]
MPWNDHSYDSCFLPLWAVANLPRNTHQLHPSKFIGAVFGDRGTNSVLSVEYYCCDRANPILQIIYMAIIGTTYYIVVKTSFSYIPGHYLSEVHRYGSFLAVAIGVFLFLLTSFSDPGTVKAENVSHAYPYENLILTKKECPTYPLDRSTAAYANDVSPALIITVDGCSSFCSLLPAHNMSQYELQHKLLFHFSVQNSYLAFLQAFPSLCVWDDCYRIGSCWTSGRIANCAYLIAYYGVDNSVPSLAPYIAQWLGDAHNTQILLMVFLAIVSLLLAGFFAYHANLCLTNTFNETFKWQDYVIWQKKVNEAQAPLSVDTTGMTGEGNPEENKCKSFFGRFLLQKTEVVKFKIDDRVKISRLAFGAWATYAAS